MNANPNPFKPYEPLRKAEEVQVSIRGLSYCIRHWPVKGRARFQILMLHGWMDVSASFQFLIDYLPDDVEAHGIRVEDGGALRKLDVPAGRADGPVARVA
ncbi:MAG: hypothetical protein RLZZ613_1476, partial [Pseudomonadota bacterium]